MRHIIIATHYNFAEGLESTVKFLTSINDIKVICAYVDENIEIEKEIEKIFSNINKLDDEVLIFTDILGGSVNQKFIPYIRENVHLITGINLPVVMSLVLKGDELITKEEIEDAIEEARQQIIYVNNFNNEKSDDDE